MALTAKPSPAPASTQPSARCSSTPSPHWPSRPRSPSPPNSNTRAHQADQLRAAAVERARYHAELARRRYLAVDPANRLVADTLEADWSNALRAHRDAQDTYDQAANTTTGALIEAQKARVRQLVADFPAIFNDPHTPHRERKRMARLLLTDVTVTKTADTVTCHIRLRGGQPHTLTLPTPKPAWLLRQNPAPGR